MTNIAAITAISVRDEATAREFLTALHVAGLSYHPDDSADDCLSNCNLDKKTLKHIQSNMTKCFNHLDPSAVLLNLMNAPDRFANTSKEFPDFDIATMPAIPEGFDDVSWHNDACPSFLNEKLGLIIFVENDDKEKREFPEAMRFGIYVWDDGNSGESVKESDDFSEILSAIENLKVSA